MTREVITCGPEMLVDEVMQVMTSGKFRHVPVVVNATLRGIVSIGDVVKYRLAEIESEREALKEYIATA
jgi:CBS domain-containing protein